MNKGLIIAGLSGGVDSTVAALLMKKAGYQVVGVTFIIGNRWSEQNLKFVEKSASELKIDLITIEAGNYFNDNILNYYRDTINSKATPSPCPICNASVKYYILHKKMLELNGSGITTGHYASIIVNNNRHFIKKSIDKKKDQSYMLYRVDDDILKILHLPLGVLDKTSVRKIAMDNMLTVHDRKDSQGLCFAPGGYKSFIENNIEHYTDKGFFKDRDGNILGEHRGHFYYTIGQRRGLLINANRVYFVIDKIPKENTVILGDFDELKRDEVIISDIKGQIEYLQEHCKNDSDKIYTARPRFSSSGRDAKISFIDNNKIRVKFIERNAESSPGQHLVLYHKQLLIGGGIIDN